MGGGAAGVPVESFIIIALCFWLLVFCIDQSKENKSNTDTMGYRGAWSGRHGAPCPSTRRGLWLTVQAPCGSAVDPPWVLSTSPLSPPTAYSVLRHPRDSQHQSPCLLHPPHRTQLRPDPKALALWPLPFLATPRWCSADLLHLVSQALGLHDGHSQCSWQT